MQDSMLVFPRRGWCSCLFTPLIMTGCPFTRSCLGAFDTCRMPTRHDSQSTTLPEMSLRMTTRVYKLGCGWKHTKDGSIRMQYTRNEVKWSYKSNDETEYSSKLLSKKIMTIKSYQTAKEFNIFICWQSWTSQIVASSKLHE